MPSKHLVDPQILPLLDVLPGFEITAESLAAVRAAVAASRIPLPALPEDLVSYEIRVPGRERDADIRLVVTAPKAIGLGRPGILHVHGGGYILGSAEMTLEIDRVYARELGAVVVSVDYRLSPETPHPGPVEDCYAGLHWLHHEAGRLGINADRIAVTGVSAGGGLAAALVLLSRARGEISIAFQHLIFPMLDDRTVVQPEPSPYLGQFVWTRANNHFGWASLLGTEPGGPDISPFAAPARALDLAGLPPTFIICGALDLFLEENLEYARRLIRSGVPTELHVYPGAPHGFMAVPDAEVTQSFNRDSMAALRRALERP